MFFLRQVHGEFGPSHEGLADIHQMIHSRTLMNQGNGREGQFALVKITDNRIQMYLGYTVQQNFISNLYIANLQVLREQHAFVWKPSSEQQS